jgi:putative copper resistance protein D
MILPADLAAFITMLLRGSQLAAQALLLGGLAFWLALARPLAPSLQQAGPALLSASRLWAGRAGLLLAAVAALNVAVNILNLHQSLDLPFAMAFGAEFILWTSLAVLGGVSAWAWLRLGGGPLTILALLGSLTLVMLASLMSSHAAARLDQRGVYMSADLLHQLGAGIWIGGIPFLLLGLGIARDSSDKALIGLRFSHMSVCAVSALALGAAVMAIGYGGSWAAVVGTAYGAMMATKLGLLGVLLLLGLMNMLSTRNPAADPQMRRLHDFAEIEIGIGMAIMFVAASLASSPPSIDQALDPAAIASLGEIADRLAPHWPRLIGPAHDLITIPGATDLLAFTSTDADKAWSEVNHHWAGLFLLAISLLAIAERTGKAPWAKHWPLLFLLLAVMLFIRSDPESWPLGPIPFFQRFLDPETAQHRLVMMLLVPFGIFEWAVRAGKLTSMRARMVFPALCALGGTLLLAHTHSLTDVKQAYLIELTHLPMGAFGILAGWARWLELRGRGWQARLGGWLWPICFTLVALLLIDYREM